MAAVAEAVASAAVTEADLAEAAEEAASAEDRIARIITIITAFGDRDSGSIGPIITAMAEGDASAFF